MMMNNKRIVNVIFTMLVGGALLTGCGSKQQPTDIKKVITEDVKKEMAKVPNKTDAGKPLSQNDKKVIAEKQMKATEVKQLMADFFKWKYQIDKNTDEALANLKLITGKEQYTWLVNAVDYCKKNQLELALMQVTPVSLEDGKTTYKTDNKEYNSYKLVTKILVVLTGKNEKNSGKLQEVTFESLVFNINGKLVVMQSNETSSKVVKQ